MDIEDIIVIEIFRILNQKITVSVFAAIQRFVFVVIVHQDLTVDQVELSLVTDDLSLLCYRLIPCGPLEKES